MLFCLSCADTTLWHFVPLPYYSAHISPVVLFNLQIHTDQPDKRVNCVLQPSLSGPLSAWRFNVYSLFNKVMKTHVCFLWQTRTYKNNVRHNSPFYCVTPLPRRRHVLFLFPCAAEGGPTSWKSVQKTLLVIIYLGSIVRSPNSVSSCWDFL